MDGAAVERRTVEEEVAGVEEFQHRRRDCGHTALEHCCVFGPVPECEPVFEDLEVGIVDPAVDQSDLLGGALVPVAVGDFEERLSLLGALEREGRCLRRWGI
jgi:hypothetical protein